MATAVEHASAAVKRGRASDCLPPSYQHSLAAEGATNLQAITSLLLSGIQLRDPRDISRALNELRQYVHQLTVIELYRFIDRKYDFPLPERAALAKQCIDALQLTGFDISMKSKFATAATDLLAYTNWNISETNIKRSKKNLQLAIQWQPLYDLLTSLMRTTRSAPYDGAAGPGARIRSLALLVVAARRYFPAGSAAEIWAKCQPLFCPYDNTCLVGQALLCTFAPLEDAAAQQSLLKRIIDMWPWIGTTLDIIFDTSRIQIVLSQSLDRCGTWDSGWIALVTRMARKSSTTLDWEPHIPIFFTALLRLLDVSLGNSQLPHPTARGTPMEASLLMASEGEAKFRDCGKLIGNLLSPKRKTQHYLEQLLRSLASYFHPSNGGAWSGKLAALLLSLVRTFAKRVAKERDTKGEHHLGEAEQRAFVEAMLPVIHTAQYAKNNDLIYSAEQSLKHLAYVLPDLVLPFQVDRAYLALTNLTATHATLSAFETLANIAHPLLVRNNYANGPASLRELLFATLPGIDPNDATKTNAVWKFYFAVFNSIPLADVSASSAKTETEFDQRAKDVTAVFGDLSVELLDRTCSYLAQKNKPEKKPSYATRMSGSLFPRVFNSMFAGLSAAQHSIVLGKLRNYVSENILPNAQKEFGFLIEAASLAQPASTLAAIVPSFVSQLLQSETELVSHSDEELAWKLHLIAAAVKRTGSILLPHIARLRPLVRLALYDERKGIQKEGVKLLRAMLFSMSYSYPTDYRAWAPNLWKASAEKDPWQHWGTRYAWAEIDIHWHIPTAEEIKAAAELTHAMSEKALARLNELASTPTLNIRRPELYMHLGVVSGVVRAAALLLPEDNTDVITRYDDEDTDTDHTAHQRTLPIELNLPSATPEVAVLATWREILHRLCHALSGVFLEQRKEDIRGSSLLIKLIGRALYTRGARATRVEVRRKFNKMILDKHRHWAVKPIRHFRYDLVAGANLRHLGRVAERGYQVPFTGTIKHLVHDLVSLSLSQYSEVRQAAQTRLQAAVKQFPMAAVPVVWDLVRVLPKATSTEEQVTGAAYCLMNKTLLRRVWRSWPLQSAFLLGLCQTHVHSKLTHQSRLFQLFAVYASGVYQLPIALPEPATTGPASAAALERTREHMKKSSERGLAAWRSTIDGLLAVLQNPDLHWRYTLVASCSLFFLIREDQHMPSSVYTWFAKCITAELPPLRTLGTKAVYNLLYRHKPHAARKSEPVTSANVIDWLTKGPYHDKNYLGWAGVPATDTIVTRTPAAQKAPTELTAIFGATAENILKLMALDHRVKDENATQSGEISRVVAGVAFLLGAQSSSVDLKDVADELIRRLVKTDFRSWPKVSSPRHSQQFLLMNARFFQRLFQVFDASILDQFQSHLVKLYGSTEEGEQCTLAEFVCGMLRAALLWDIDSAGFAKVKAFATKTLHEAVINRQLTVEMITMWGTGLRYAIYDFDRRRYKWLSDLFFAVSLNDVSETFALSAAKSLYFMRSFLLETTWRAPDSAVDLLTALRPLLGHPYKQARLEVAQLLYISTVVLAFPPAGAVVPQVVGDTIERLATDAQALSDQGTDITEEKSKERSAWRDTVSTYQQSLFRHFSAAAHPHYAACVSILLHCQNDVDAEVSKMGKAGLALAAQVISRPEDLQALDAVLLHFSKSYSWHVRQALLPFIQLVAFNHQFMIADLGAMREFAVSALTDVHVEVRELASHSLSSLLRVVPADEAKKLTARFAKLAATPLPKTKGQLTPEENSARITRHAGVLGLIGLLHSQPYELPDWMVDTLLLLARHSNDPSPINTSVRRAFAEFFRTHQDMWHVHKEKFSRDDLYTINQLILSPSMAYA